MRNKYPSAWLDSGGYVFVETTAYTGKTSAFFVYSDEDIIKHDDLHTIEFVSPREYCGDDENLPKFRKRYAVPAAIDDDQKAWVVFDRNGEVVSWSLQEPDRLDLAMDAWNYDKAFSDFIPAREEEIKDFIKRNDSPRGWAVERVAIEYGLIANPEEVSEEDDE